MLVFIDTSYFALYLLYCPFCMTQENNNIKFPLWEYLNQPVFSHKTKLILSPRRFAHLHRVQLLKRCLAKKFEAKGSQ
ncbi:hypothetical protein SD80_004445 [Scytonema tolypothrichoides VB-61278]|nr:hypothetical protein SD80_004445 [Scytonema tolypothrichoides VB-61278]